MSAHPTLWWEAVTGRDAQWVHRSSSSIPRCHTHVLTPPFTRGLHEEPSAPARIALAVTKTWRGRKKAAPLEMNFQLKTQNRVF